MNRSIQTAAAALLVMILLPAVAIAQTAACAPPQSCSTSEALPDAPSPANQQAAAQGQAVPPADRGAFGPVPPVYTAKPLTFHDKWTIYTHETYGPPAFFNPAVSAGIRMANPKKNYPKDWKDGGPAYGRLYGSTIATQTSKHTAEFLTEVALHEDPRYRFAPKGSNTFVRIAHAIAFTVVDRTDSGRHTLAVANFAGAAAAGFTGMAYLPDGYNDVTHAGQRATAELGKTAIANIAREFSPQWGPIVQKLHIPKIIPAWWVPEHRVKQ
jgi:hypothetical protein